MLKDRMWYVRKPQQRTLAMIKGLGIGLVIAIGVGIVCIEFVVPMQVSRMKEQEALAHEEGTINAWLLKDTIKQGQTMTKDNFTKIQVPKNAVPNNVITDLKLVDNKVARVELPPKTSIFPSLITDSDNAISDDLRLQDYSYIKLSDKLMKGQYVDIRLRRTDGSDDIVLSKKKIMDINGTSIAIYLDENERLTLSSATVEADATKAQLYTTVYIDPQNQPKAVTSYKVDPKIKKMIEDNEQIIQDSAKRLTQQNQNNSTVQTGTSNTVVPPANTQQNNSTNNANSTDINGQKPSGLGK
jgi:hypothetical protein